MKIKDGKSNGLFKSFYNKGQLQTRGRYLDGKEEGYWESYDEKGNLIETQEYKDGRLIKKT